MKIPNREEKGQLDNTQVRVKTEAKKQRGKIKGKFSLLHSRGTSTHSAHGVKTGRQLGVLLLDLQLSAGSLGVGDGVDDLGLGASQLGSALEVLQSLGDLALLKEELGHGADSNVALGVDDESLLAEVLGLLEVVLPLEQGEGLVDQGQNVDAHGLALLLHLHGLVELLDGLGVVLLVEQELTVVVVYVRDILEVLNRPAESGHGRSNGAHLVLCHTELNVGVDESAVEINRLLVVLGGLGKLGQDEVELGAVVVDIGVILVVGDSKLKVVSSSILVAELQVQAGALDVALDQRRREFNTLVKVSESTSGVTAKVGEGSAHIQGQSFKFTKVTDLEGLLERGGSLLVTISGLLAHSNETLAQLALAGLLVQLNGLFQAFRQGLGTEALEVVGNKGGAGKLLGARLQDSLALLLGNLLQQALEGVAADVVRESVDDTAGGEVEESLAVLLEVLVCDSSPVEGLDVFAVHGESGAGVLNDLLPVGLHVITGGAVGVEDGVRLAKNSLAVQINGVGVVLGSISLVTSSLQLGGICVAGLIS